MPRRQYGTGSVEKRGHNVYSIRWSEGRDPFTGRHIQRRETLHGVTKSQAEQILAQRRAARRRSTRMTLGQLLAIALPELDVTAGTLERYEHAVKIIPDGAKAWTLDVITVPMAGDLFKRLAEQHGAATVNKAHTAIMSCYRQAYRNGWVGKDDNPFAGIKLPKARRSAGKLLTRAELRKLVAVAETGQEEAWIVLHITTAARPGEVRSLRWSQVDLANAVVSFVDEKHHGAIRHVAVDELTVDVLERWHAKQREAHANLCDDPYLFSTAKDASTPWAKEYVRDRWHSIGARAGIKTKGENRTRLYDIRHTNNSEMAAAGIDDDTRSKRIGNSRELNRDVYTHLVPEADRRAASEAGSWLR